MAAAAGRSGGRAARGHRPRRPFRPAYPAFPGPAALAATTAAVSWYTADLADPGGPLDAVVDQIAAVVGRVRDLREGAPVVLVAHSTASPAARAFAAAHPELLAGLITIGTPHGPAPLTVLDDPAQADALRLPPASSAPPGVTGPLRDVLDHLLAAAEGWQATSTLPTRLAYPRERFTGDSDHGTGGVPALAIAGQLSDDLLTRLGDALAQTLTAAATGARPPARLGVGVRVGRGHRRDRAWRGDRGRRPAGRRHLYPAPGPDRPGRAAAGPAGGRRPHRPPRAAGWSTRPSARASGCAGPTSG